MLAARLQSKITHCMLYLLILFGEHLSNSELIAEARQKQNAIRKKLVAKGISPFDIRMHVISDFPLTKYINDFISEHRIDYIVMGTHGSSGMSKTKLGSFTMGIIDNISIPIIAVPAGAKAEAISHILYPTDLEDALGDTRKPFTLAKALSATIHIVYVPDDSILRDTGTSQSAGDQQADTVLPNYPRSGTLRTHQRCNRPAGYGQDRKHPCYVRTQKDILKTSSEAAGQSK